MRHTQTLKILIILSILSLGALFGYWYFYKTIVAIKADTLSMQEDSAEKQGQDIHLQSVKQLLVDSTADRAEAARYVVGQDAVVSFIKTIEGLAKSQGLSVRTTGVSVFELATSSKLYENVRLDVETSGSWQRNYRFLTLIESLPYKLIFNRVEFRLNEENGKTKTTSWKGNFEIVALKEK